MLSPSTNTSLSITTTSSRRQAQPQVSYSEREKLTLYYFIFRRLNHFIMSSSIVIPSRTGYGENSKAAASSSSSSYSTSPRTPQSQQNSAPASPSNKFGHDRRPSLLSEFISLIPLIVQRPDREEMARFTPLLGA